MDDKIKKFAQLFDMVVPENKDNILETKQEQFKNNSFDSLVEIISEDIDSTKKIIKSKKEESKNDIEEQKKDSDLKTEIKELDEFDSLPLELIKQKNEKIEEKKNLKEEIKTIEKVKTEEEIKVKNNLNSEMEWLLESPSPLYDEFYKQKKQFIYQKLCGGISLPFSKYKKELEESFVNVVTEIFDNVENQKKMDEVQQYRNRVRYIEVQCNNQYFILRRFMEIFRGLLSRIQYEKPIIKQEGVYYEHLRDLEYYFVKLESLHSTVEKISKNLDGAWETLSRKITVCLELRTGDKYEKKYTRNDSHLNLTYNRRETQEQEYDNLPQNVKIKPEKKVNKFLGWEEIG